MSRFKFFLILVIGIAFVSISVSLVYRINNDKIYNNTNLSTFVYPSRLQSVIYFQHKDYIDTFVYNVPVGFDSIYQLIKYAEYPYCISRYQSDIFVLQLKINSVEFKKLNHIMEPNLAVKEYGKQSIYIIESAKDKCIFAYYADQVLTFSTSYSLLQEIIEFSKKDNTSKISEIFDIWVSLESEVKIYNNDSSGFECASTFENFDTFIDGYSIYNYPDSTINQVVQSFINDSCKIFDVENKESKENKEIIFKIK